MSIKKQNNIKNLIKTHHFQIKKKYGQNFLVDNNMLDKIVRTAQIDKNDFVLEIGSGMGSLTKRLLDYAGTVLAYEIDDTLIPVLKEAFDETHFHLIHDDILKRDIDADIAQVNPDIDSVTVIANLPYYITTPILMKCLEESKKIKRMVVMMQLEVARRMTASKNTKEYNALSILIAYRARPAFAFKVPKDVFIPAPNVESAVITLDFYDKPPYDVLSEDYFIKFVKASFKQRRKTLVNNLHSFTELDKAHIITMLETLHVHPQCRAESLKIETFVTLSNAFYKKLKQENE